MSFTVGSLFDGSGGFPLAAFMCGGEPLWASEVEPYPIAVTKSRFPYMKHLGDVRKVRGYEIDPVDVLCFGSPCQDLSVAGKRGGLKHEDNGDDETTRSGLFMEAVRIIKEMREATNGRYPNIVLWENVPGAFSSNKGEDFRIVLEEFIKIVEPDATMPTIPKRGWSYADSYVGNGWSLAYRVFDSQYWGVPQRRRRLYLILDLGGERARKILFERDGLRGYFAEGRAPWKRITSDIEGSVDTDDRTRDCIAIENHPNDSRVNVDESGTIQTLTGRMGTGGGNVPLVMEPFCKSKRARSSDDATTWKHAEVANTLNVFDLGEARANELIVEEYPSYCLQGKSIGRADKNDCNGMGYSEEVCYTLDTVDRHAVVYRSTTEEPIVIDRAFFNQGQNAQYEPQCYDDGVVPTLVARGPSAVCYWDGSQTVGTLTARNAGGAQRMPDKENFNCVIQTKPRYIVRRLTPTECGRLQGFPDNWGHPDKKSEFKDGEYKFWLDVRKTFDEINERNPKDYTEKQILTWYNKLHNDSAEYKMWGNGIALPNALYCMQGIADEFN